MGPLVVGVVVLLVLVGAGTAYLLQRDHGNDVQVAGAPDSAELDGLTADQLGQMLGCTDEDSDPAPDAVACSTSDYLYAVKTFATQSALDTYADQATALTLALVGHNFVVEAPNQDALIAAQASVGGDIEGPDN